MSGPIDSLGVAVQVLDALEAVGARGTIGGSIAASFAGEPRSTIDIDVVTDLTDEQVTPLVEALSGEFYIDERGLRRAVATSSSTNLIHQLTQIKVDIFIAGGTPLDEQQLRRRMPVTVGGRRLFVHPPEDILLQKLRWYRAGGEVSDRQWRDIQGIIRAQGARLDRPYLMSAAPSLGVEDLLRRALHEAI